MLHEAVCIQRLELWPKVFYMNPCYTETSTVAEGVLH